MTFIDKSVMTEKEPNIPIFTDFIFYKKCSGLWQDFMIVGSDTNSIEHLVMPRDTCKTFVGRVLDSPLVLGYVTIFYKK